MNELRELLHIQNAKGRNIETIRTRLLKIGTSDTFLNKYRDSEMSHEDWLRTISQNQEMIKSPIVMYPEQAELIDSPYELLKKDMNDNENGFTY